MIVKKINVSRPKAKASSIRDLTNYIRAPSGENEHEKVLYANGRGFICDGHRSQQAEMIALASECVKSKHPVSHYIVSWREGEQPSDEQVEQTVTIFLAELGLSEHQTIFALHKDTANIHLHLAVNRVHPDTCKIIEINNGFDLEAAHMAVARIEFAQGWQREHNGRYVVLGNGELAREHQSPDAPRQPSQPRRDMENRTGEKSAARIAIEQASPIIRRATSWQQLHRELAASGMRYERTGSGATIFVGTIGVKASSADRGASFGQLQKRLGIYEPSKQSSPQPERQPTLGAGNALDPQPELQPQPQPQPQPEPIKQDVPGWDAFISIRKAHYAAKSAATLATARQHEAERRTLSEQQKQRRSIVLQGDWKRRGDHLNALRSVLAGEQAAAKAGVRERQQRERKWVRDKFRPFPDLEQWQRQQSAPALAEQWRHRASEPQGVVGQNTEPPTPRDIRAYAAEIVGRQVHYSQWDDTGGGRGVSFVDHGRNIDVYHWRDGDTTLAALQLAAQKWGTFAVTGSDEYKAACAILAAAHGFKITNPELWLPIQQERDRMQQESKRALQSEPLRQFEAYHDAVGADRYRVTSIRLKPDGGQMTFIVDKKDGVTRGFTPQEMAQHGSEMKRLAQRGENIYYTPLSGDKHHILIDDMSRETLALLQQDGFSPAVVLESSLGNFQALITVPKLGTPHDKDVGNRLAEQLNRRYGDAKLSGCVHPHRAPGYENRKPKHRREDGSYPEVRLLRAERRECGKTLALASQIDAVYQQHAVEKAQEATQRTHDADEVAHALGAASDGVVAAFERHHRDVLERQRGGHIDLSRVDSMIAVRLRVTGHTQADIEVALRQCAPAARSQEAHRDWTDYAQRTVRCAFSAAGDRQVATLAKYRDQWRDLELATMVREHDDPVLER